MDFFVIPCKIRHWSLSDSIHRYPAKCIPIIKVELNFKPIQYSEVKALSALRKKRQGHVVPLKEMKSGLIVEPNPSVLGTAYATIANQNTNYFFYVLAEVATISPYQKTYMFTFAKSKMVGEEKLRRLPSGPVSHDHS